MFMNLYLSFCSVFADDFCFSTQSNCNLGMEPVGATVIAPTASIPGARKLWKRGG